MDFEDLDKYLSPVLEKLGTMEEETLKNWTTVGEEVVQNVLFGWWLKRNVRRSADVVSKVRNGDSLDKGDFKVIMELISYVPYAATVGVKRAQRSYERMYTALDALKADKGSDPDPKTPASKPTTVTDIKTKARSKTLDDFMKEVGGF